jgi:hypothetical protein
VHFSDVGKKSDEVLEDVLIGEILYQDDGWDSDAKSWCPRTSECHFVIDLLIIDDT